MISQVPPSTIPCSGRGSSAFCRAPIFPSGSGSVSVVKDSHLVPGLSIFRDVLIRIDPLHLNRGLQLWNHTCDKEDQSTAIGSKTMRNTIDLQGKDITEHALLTQRKLADYLCLQH